MANKNVLFEPNICPFCGSATLFLMRRMTKDIFELIKKKEEIEGFVGDALRMIETMLDEEKIKAEMEIIAKEAFTNEVLSLIDDLGNSVKLKLEDGNFGLTFNYAWIYVKLWQERSWIGLKFGKTSDFEKREKQYDDHDYILNLCVPVPDFTLNEYEKFLEAYIIDGLIPFVLECKKKRLKDVLGGDFESVELKSGIAPDRKEYWRLYIHPSSNEYEFLIANLETFFAAFTKPGWPITYKEWLVLKNRESNQHMKKMQKGHQPSLFTNDTEVLK